MVKINDVFIPNLGDAVNIDHLEHTPRVKGGYHATLVRPFSIDDLFKL
jgi:hypothetical protein